MCEYLGLIEPETQMLQYNNSFIFFFSFIYFYFVFFSILYFFYLKLLNNFYYKNIIYFFVHFFFSFSFLFSSSLSCLPDKPFILVHFRSRLFRPPHRTARTPPACLAPSLTLPAQNRCQRAPESREVNPESYGQLALSPSIWPPCRRPSSSFARPNLETPLACHHEADWSRRWPFFSSCKFEL